MITPDQQAAIGRYFDELFELPAAVREAALAGISDEIVRSEVASLLLHIGPGETLAGAVGDMIQAAATAGSFAHRVIGPGTVIGHYRVERKLGQGGMGEVYEAVREDDFRQRVALKIVRYGMDTEFALRRFQQERQFLASLEHPNIARLIDGGTSDTGALYLVLEFVDGTPLDIHAASLQHAHKLAVFLKICDAVDYAHRRLIIHRDLKPANILVTPGGEPKLLDFGIAKLADAGAADLTRTQFQALTPQYASPEQIRNELVTTASDVYSLGLILYELLCGRRPYDVGPSTSLLDIHRTITETEPAKPGLGGDLDNILLMALRKDPARRYASVRDLADDIRRSLENRPVLARPDTLGYRARKFLRRNRLAVSAAALLTLAVTSGLAASLYQANLARQRFEQVRKLAHTFVFDIHDEVAKVDGTTAARELVVRTAVEYLDQLSQAAGSDLRLKEELADAYVKVGDAQGTPGAPNLGHTDAALLNYGKAARLYESLAAADPAKRLNLARFYTRFGKLKHLTGDTKGGAVASQQALAILEPMATAPNADPAATYAFVATLSDLGEIRGDSASMDKAAQWLEPMLKRSRSRQNLILAQKVYGERMGIVDEGRISEGLRSLEEQEKILRELLAAEPANPVLRRALAVNAQDRSTVYYDDFYPNLNDPPNALLQARVYLDIARVTSEADPKNAAARFSYAIALSRVAVPERFSNPAAAAGRARQALAILLDLEASRPAFLNRSRLPRVRRILALALMAARNLPAALSEAGKAVAEQRVLVAAKPDDDTLKLYLTACLYALGVIQNAAHDPGATATLLEALRSIRPDGSGETPSPTMAFLRAKILLATGDREAAARVWDRFPRGNEFADRMRAYQ